ncbi:hypothetical protein HNP48_000554 [Acidovorax soli]|uniref:Uncharacterized protein n=1 Tax=Acidovorax soli TaxID=592050 RepID=A0A7X0P9P5_9BURK|nr:hypothetical protein [Acidovorax soli]
MLGRHAATGQRGNCHAARRGPVLLQAGDSRATAAPHAPPPVCGPGPTAALSPPLFGVRSGYGAQRPSADICFCLRRPDFSPRWTLSHLYSFNWNVSACFLLPYGNRFSLLFVAYIACLLRGFLGVLGIFPQMARLRPERRQFNEFVTNGAETAAEPVPIQKFLANLRPTHRKHGMANRQDSLLEKSINKSRYKTDRYTGNTRINWQEPGK